MKYAKVITGDVIFKKFDDYSDVEEIKGSLYCGGADTKAAFPKLTTIGGSLYCDGADTRAAFPKLTTIGGSLYCGGADTKAAFPKLTTIGGSLDCCGADTRAAFPKLTTIGDYLYCGGTDTKAAFPKLTTIGGYLDCSGTDTKAAFPMLTTQNCGDAKAMKNVTAAFRRSGFVRFDGILSFIMTTKFMKSGIKIHRIVVVGKAKSSFCVETRDGTFSHGDTIRQAK